MKTDYRARIVKTALRLVGSTEMESDELFNSAYTEMLLQATRMIGTDDMRFCTYAARLAGVPVSVFPNMSDDEDVVRYYKSKSLYITDDSYVPRAGDLLVCEDAHGDNSVGIVIKIERGKVSYATCAIGGDGIPKLKNIMAPSSFIRGYIVPDYDFAVTKGMLRKTQLPAVIKGTRVRRFQQWLDKKLNEGAEIDGKTDAAFKASCMAAWRRQMNRDCKAKLPLDGKFDDSCLAAASNRLLKIGSSGNMVYILQGLLYSHGYDPKGFNGRFNDETREALAVFQKARRLEESGTTDAQTWKSILSKW